MKMNSWMNSPSWDQSAPKTVQVIVLATSGAHAKATCLATAPIVPVSTKAPISELLENKLTTVVLKYITA
jgi:hypothetical protein